MALLRAAYLAEGLIRREDSAGGMDPNALMDIIDTGFKNSPEAVMDSLDIAYGPGWSYVPLMMDIEYALEDSEGISLGADNGRFSPPPAVDGSSLGRNGVFGYEAPPGGADRFDRVDRGPRRRFLKRLEEAWRVLFGEGLEWGARRLLAGDSFELQRRELTELKAARPERVFPFLGIDPRKQHVGGVDLVEYIGDYAGPGRPFAGVKLYTSSGYSPTDPVLFGRKGVYAHCRRRRIPVTVHFGASGFATPLQAVRVRGDVYDPLCGDAVPADLCRFDVKMTPGTINAAVRERQMKLNHPRLWKKVLDRWPGLVINFAHAGGAPQAAAWLDDPVRPGWTAWALRQAARRRGVYVDLSGYAPGGIRLTALAERMRRRRPSLRRKILYGSDYFLSALKDPDIRAYRDAHRASFGTWWRAVSERNPKRFLAGGR
jgi:predicted TIM-barrel fold metal-dependent hydrolase